MDPCVSGTSVTFYLLHFSFNTKNYNMESVSIGIYGYFCSLNIIIILRSVRKTMNGFQILMDGHACTA